MNKITKIIAWTGASLVVGFFLFYFLFLNHVSVNELGVAYNASNGNMVAQEHPGWYLTSPLTRVAYLNLLPERVEIPSSAKVINAKMVRFKKEGWREYVEIQGFGYDLNTTQSSAMLGYAFSGKDWPFLEITEELAVATTTTGTITSTTRTNAK